VDPTFWLLLPDDAPIEQREALRGAIRWSRWQTSTGTVSSTGVGEHFGPCRERRPVIRLSSGSATLRLLQAPRYLWACHQRAHHIVAALNRNTVLDRLW